MIKVSEAAPNFELVEKVRDAGSEHNHPAGVLTWVDVVEAAVLALVAVSTAWSGFQATKWSGFSLQEISQGLRTTVLSQEKATLAGQDHLYDALTFNAWLKAKAEHNEYLAAFYARRFRPEYATVFAAWLKLEPFQNKVAPPGPSFMQEYIPANAQESARLNEEAKARFEKGVAMRETSEEYVRVTVFLATVLLCTAIGQRIRTRWARSGVAVAASILLASSAYYLLTLPRTW